MKIYTEEQVKQIQQAILCNHKDAIMDANYCLSVTTPIELPSDEDVEKMRKAYIEHVNIIVHKDLERDIYLDIGFHVGAKSMRDKIQGGNK
jgi:hypothetical protein